MNHSPQIYDAKLLAAAALVCVVGCFTAVTLLARAKVAVGPVVSVWLTAAAAVFGCSVWALHFVAMLAFMPATAISYDVGLTVISIIIATVVALLAFTIWLLVHRHYVGTILGGTTLALAVSGMHFTGVSAMRLSGDIAIDRPMAMIAMAVGLVLSVLALVRAQALRSILRRVEVTGLLVAAICGVHFLGMEAVSFVARMSTEHPGAGISVPVLAVVVGAVSLLIVVLSLAATLAEQHLSQRAIEELGRMRMMSDFDLETIIVHRDGKILEVNSAGARLFDLIPDMLLRRSFTSLLSPDSAAALNRHGHRRVDDKKSQEITIRTDSGRLIPVDFSSRIIDYQGKPATAVSLRDLTDSQRNEARLRHLAHHDALTGLPNRFLLEERLSYALDIAARSKTSVIVLYLDLDRFKAVNDVNGHAHGDALLIQASKRLILEVGASDTVARVGGDEFVIVLTTTQTPGKALTVATKIIDQICRPFDIDGRYSEVGVSIGVALYPNDGGTPQSLLHAADTAMYRAKEERHGSLRFFEASMNSHLHDRLLLEQDLRQAIRRGEISLHYQPILAFRTGKIHGFEALLRWNHPHRGPISPAVFIPIAEDIGLISELGQWALQTACDAASTWHEPWCIAVNMSPVQFRQVDLQSMVSTVLLSSGLDPRRLEIEITENVFIDDAERAVLVLTGLRDQGIKLALDDFGTGYSSLSYLRLFSFDKIKIDRSFVRDLGKSSETLMIITAIINLGHNLGLTIVVEGVETEQQLGMLALKTNDQVQGYLFGRPAAMATFTTATLDRSTAALQSFHLISAS